MPAQYKNMPSGLDDKSDIVIPFILQHLESHRKHSDAPFFIGLNGVQGVGKTTLVTALETTLRSAPYNLPTITLSIDDLYLTRAAQVELASAHPQNPLIQHRGEPSTHDVALGSDLFRALKHRGTDIRIPFYDKSMHDGKGDRVPEEDWRVVNGKENEKVEVVVFEGWCVGFRPLTKQDVEERWKEAVEEESQVDGGASGRLGKQRLQDVLFVNEALRQYDQMTNHLDAFVHIDAEDTHYVYDWRLEQEAKMREAKGRGMTDAQVIDFVNGYYPAYELFTDRLRNGIFPGQKGRQLRIIVKKDRKVIDSKII